MKNQRLTTLFTVTHSDAVVFVYGVYGVYAVAPFTAFTPIRGSHRFHRLGWKNIQHAVHIWCSHRV